MTTPNPTPITTAAQARAREIIEDRRYSDEFVGSWFRSHPAALTDPRVERLTEALADALAYIRGDISGPSQKAGILREGDQALAAVEAGR